MGCGVGDAGLDCSSPYELWMAWSVDPGMVPEEMIGAESHALGMS